MRMKLDLTEVEVIRPGPLEHAAPVLGDPYFIAGSSSANCWSASTSKAVMKDRICFRVELLKGTLR